MIRLRLKELLKEYGVSISEVSQQTGINRASLSSLAENRSKMVRFETLDRLNLFFQLESAVDLITDDQSASITCQPYQMENHQVRLEFVVDVQLVRDAISTQATFNVIASFKKIERGQYILFGNPDHSNLSEDSWAAVVKLFKKIHPIAQSQFFFRLSDRFLSAPFEDLAFDNEAGVFSKEQIEVFLNETAKLTFSIPELNLITVFSFDEAIKIDDNRIQVITNLPESSVFEDLVPSQQALTIGVKPVKV